MSLKNSEEDEAGYAVLGRLGNPPCFLLIETFLNVSEQDAFKQQLKISKCLGARGCCCVHATIKRGQVSIS
jgi:hypothetical protein